MCNLSTEPLSIEAGQIEQAFEAHMCAAAGQPLRDCGMALTPRPLAALAIKRARSRGLSILARVGEVAVIAAPLVLGFSAAGIVQFSGWQVGAVAGLGTGLRLVSDATRAEREDAFSLADLGQWLSDQGKIALDSGTCSPRLLAMGSYRRGQAETVAIEAE